MTTGLQKMRQHINALNLKKTKLGLYLEEENRKLSPDPVRVADIERALGEVEHEITMLEQHLANVR